jgi:ABC-2 type transport system permease protein
VNGRQPQPLSTVRAVWLVAGLTLRRQLNMLHSVRLLRAKKDAGAERSGTATKAGRRGILGGVVFLFVLANGFIVSSTILVNLSAAARHVTAPTGQLLVSRFTMTELVSASRGLKESQRITEPIQREKYVGAWNRFIDGLFRAEIRWRPFTENEEGARLSEMHRVFNEKGTSGFAPEDFGGFMVSRTTWPRDGDAKAVFFRSLSAIVLLWIPILLGFPLGMNNKDLGQLEWSFEWLYTFPASARALFASKLFAYSFLNPIGWAFLFPLLILAFIAGGYGIAAAIALGFAAAVYMQFVTGAVVLVVEVALRKYLNLRQIKNAQAFFTVLATLGLLIFYATPYGPLASSLVHRAARLPAALAWNPFLMPLWLATPQAPDARLRLDAFGMISAALAMGWLSLLGSEWLTRGGLVTAGGPYQGRRGSRPAIARLGWLRGVAAQEMLVLARDRNLQVQVLILPLLLPAFYMLTNAKMMHAVLGNVRHAAMMAFAVGAYAYMIGAIQMLSREGKTVWLLLSFPRSLTSILLRKTAVWAGVGLLYCVVMLALLAHSGLALHPSSWGAVGIALYGVALYAFIASGIGILATDIQESEPRRALGVGPIYLYMMLAAMYVATFYAPSLWRELGQLVLCTLLAVALWQKVSDLCPYLLDPTDQPPRAISLADGMIAAFAFFVLQGVVAVFLHYASAGSPTAQITCAYVVAGVVVACAVLCVFWLKGVPDLWRQIVVAAGSDRKRTAPAREPLLFGASLGLAAALGAFIYLHTLSLFAAGQLWRHDAELMSFMTPGRQPLWMYALLVLAAPLFEEFIFRGLVFQGLRRSSGPALAVVGSAALFALVHPPIAVIPVFGLGIAAAISFDRSRIFWAPVITHAVYNGCVLLLNLL